MTARETLDGIRAQLAGITPGQWKAWDRGIGYEVHSEHDEPLNTGFRETFTKPDAEFIASAPSTVARLSNAVEAVLALHEPITHHFLTPPAGSVDVCHSCREEYPCPTVAAVENALKEGQ